MFRIGDLVIPVISIKGVFQRYPVGKLINVHKKHYEDGTSDVICYFVDLTYEFDEPHVIRCCLLDRPE